MLSEAQRERNRAKQVAKTILLQHLFYSPRSLTIEELLNIPRVREALDNASYTYHGKRV